MRCFVHILRGPCFMQLNIKTMHVQVLILKYVRYITCTFPTSVSTRKHVHAILEQAFSILLENCKTFANLQLGWCLQTTILSNLLSKLEIPAILHATIAEAIYFSDRNFDWIPIAILEGFRYRLLLRQRFWTEVQK